jgi:hypothetical protein
MKAPRYLRFRQASVILAQTERDARRIWSVYAKRSSGGNDFVNSNISIAALKPI